MNEWTDGLPPDRRSAYRYRCDIQTVCRLSEEQESNAWPSRLQNISSGGVALLIDRQLEAGTPLHIELPDLTWSLRRKVPIRVIHVRAHSAVDWLLGAAFPERMNDDDLLAIARRCRQPTLLVVEEETELLELLGKVFRSHDFQVCLAGGGREAIEVYRHHWEEIDVVLLDVGMYGLDGPHTLAALRRINPDLCCWFMTGGSPDYSEEKLLSYGAVQVFYKPFSMDYVVNSLNLFLGRKRSNHR
jgi:CheY-like chemotaxis protein